MNKLLSVILTICILASVTAFTAMAEDTDVLSINVMNLPLGRIVPVISRFQEKYPDARIDLQSFRGANGSEYSTNALQHNDQADVYFTTKVEDKQEAMKANLIDLSQYAFLNSFVPSFLDIGTVDGGVYLLPLSTTVYGILYNKTLLREMGLDLPQTYADLVAIKAACDEKGILMSRVDNQLPGGNFQYLIYLARMSFLGSLKGKQWEKKFLAGEEVDFDIWDDTFAYLQKLMDVGFYYTDEQSDGDADPKGMFYEGKSLFFVGQTVLNTGMTEQTGYEYGVMPYISEDGANNIYWYTASQLVGLSKKLDAPGCEKKKELAIAFLEYLFSDEGQALYGTGTTVLPMMKDQTVEPDSIVYDAYLASLDGRVVQQIYGSWHTKGLVIPVGDAMKALLAGKATVEDVKNVIHDTMAANAATGGVPVYGTVTEDLTLEQSAKIICQVYGNMLGTDVAIMSLGGYHGDLKDNGAGVNGILYAGDFNQEDSWVPLPGNYNVIAKLKLTGAQIRQLVADGYDKFDDGTPYPYILATRDGLTLEDDTVYEVAMANSGYTDAVAEMGQVEIVKIDNFLNVYTETMGALSPISPDMAWK